MATPTPQVTLREITARNMLAVSRLAVAEDQQHLVATNAVSLAQAACDPSAWMRAVCVGDEPVGFVLLDDESLLEPKPAAPEAAVWRFMIDRLHQGGGIGRAAMLAVIEHVRARGFRRLTLSYVPGPRNPEPFYRALGFRETGNVDEDGEREMELVFADEAT